VITPEIIKKALALIDKSPADYEYFFAKLNRSGFGTRR